jgi:hypothetical protein
VRCRLPPEGTFFAFAKSVTEDQRLSALRFQRLFFDMSDWRVGNAKLYDGNWICFGRRCAEGTMPEAH